VNKFVVLSGGKPSFTEDKIVLAYDLVADTNRKTATINNVSLDMASSKAAGVMLKGAITDWGTQRKLDGVTCDLAYDLAKIWQIAKPMMSPETQKNYDDLKVAGVYKRTFNISGAFPASADWHESIKSLSLDGAVGVQQLYTMGLDVREFELPVTLDKGVLTTLYARKPKGERNPKPAQINGGTGNLSAMLVNLTTPQPLLSIGKNQQLLKDVQLNTILADRLGKFASVLFKDPQRASGQIDLSVIECDGVPLGDLIARRNNGRAKIDLKIRDLQLDSPALKLLAAATQMGQNGITGEISGSGLVYRGPEGGITHSEVNIFLNRKGTPYPLSFVADINLDSFELHNAFISIAPQLFGSDDLTRLFPSGMKVAVTGTVDKFKIDTASILKQNIPGIIGGVLGGNKKDDATGQKQPNDLGGLLQDVLGGKKPDEQPKDQPPPSSPPKKKKK
jgi:hypothetical protein